MCGIVGIVSDRTATPRALRALGRLEMRGYDSAGVAVCDGDSLKIMKREGKLSVLSEALKQHPLEGNTVIAHTRWATHGRASDRNAHPHVSTNGRIAVVHNGIVANYEELRHVLEQQGYEFTSETDTEVLAHLFEREFEGLRGENIPYHRLERAVVNALKFVEGDDCAFLVISADSPNEIVAYRRDRPLVLGRNGQDTFVASDEIALAGKVSHIYQLQSRQIATLSRDRLHIEGFNEEELADAMQPIKVSEQDVTLSGYPYWMLQEIFEQPAAMARAITGRFDASKGTISLEMLDQHKEVWRTAERIYIVACGTSLHAAMLGKILIEENAHIQVEVVIGSEWGSSKHLVGRRTPVIGLSQSGMTADVVDPLIAAQACGAPIFGVTNSSTSQLAMMVVNGVLIKAGHEVAVASTKTFTSQVAVLMLIAFGLKKIRESANEGPDESLHALERLPDLLAETLECDAQVQSLAKDFSEASCCIIMGRGLGVPIAYEGALKLREIAYIHAHGHPAGEFKHGHLALVEEGVPVIGILLPDGNEKKMMTALEQAKARGGKIVVIDLTGREDLMQLADYLIRLPKAPAFLSPVLATVPLQLLSYWSGLVRGNDVDKPRNLAKSVTVS